MSWLPELERGRSAAAPALSAEVSRAAATILDDVRRRGEAAVREHGERLGDLATGAPLWIEREQLDSALRAIAREDRLLLERTAARIEAFARAQREALLPVEFAGAPGMRSGMEWMPLAQAGCYAPGGRHPLPSSVLMTACVARVAGVTRVLVASPRPAPITLAAAAVAGADRLLAVGGAQAVGALAFGIEGERRCDVVVGPGNAYVTAAKAQVAARTRIDMLAGPSELLVVADATADPAWIAADLLAQAEHDVDARPMLIALDDGVIAGVEAELTRQLRDLPTAEVARRALANGFAHRAADLGAAAALADEIAPEHLELMFDGAERERRRFTNYGGLFVGAHAAEVLGDYGAGPNHVLPTGGTARSASGLGVSTFLRSATWLRVDDPVAARPVGADATRMARQEGLAGHARAAAVRWAEPAAAED